MPAVELRKLAARGGIQRVGHGVYRFEDIPHTDKDQFMEAVLRVGPDAHLVGDAVLALNDLGLVNPRRIRVAVPHRDRHELPDYIEVVRETIPEPELTQYEGVPATTIARALLECRTTVMNDRLIDAAHEAARNGLLRRREVARVLAELGASEDVDA